MKSAAQPQRDPACVKRWPECESGAYDPRCCRFPKSCACTSYPPDESPAACTCKGWRGTWRTLLWGIPHVFCDRCNREVRDA